MQDRATKRTNSCLTSCVPTLSKEFFPNAHSVSLASFNSFFSSSPCHIKQKA